MRLTFEAHGHTFTLALTRDEPYEPEPIHPEGDVYAMTERRKSTDYENEKLVGFVTSKGRS